MHERTYKIEQVEKKFVTHCYNDGYYAISWWSKNKKLARKKGEEYVSGKRTATRKYVTKMGQLMNMFKSQGKDSRTAAIMAVALANEFR